MESLSAFLEKIRADASSRDDVAEMDDIDGDDIGDHADSAATIEEL